MIRKAGAFIATNGPATQQDRWEEEAGYSPYTLAVEIAALLTAARLAALPGETRMAAFWHDTADAWNADIETWTYVSDAPWAREAHVEGYYIRINPGEGEIAAAGVRGTVIIRNRRPEESEIAAEGLISTDALALVRFGLRAADDPRILATVRMIDRFLRVELPQGPGWRRYNRDGYGEHHDGRPFDGVGEGRPWPLLIGERAHYALALGDEAEARRLRAVMEACTSDGGMLPEQVWDDDDIPARELFRGRPTGSAMPLVWAHAEYITLLRSLASGEVFDRPAVTVQRYLRAHTRPRLRNWREGWRRTTLPAGQTLRIDLTGEAIIRWTADDWQTVQNTRTCDTGLGIHVAELATDTLPAGRRIEFTWRRMAAEGWIGRNYVVRVVGADRS